MDLKTIANSDPVSSIPIRNVWHMLIYAWDLTHWRDIARFESEESPNLLGLLARVLVDSTEILLKHQLGRSYADKTTVIRGIRGQIQFAESLRYFSRKESKVVCKFSELTIDTPNNRIIKSTLHWLAHQDGIRNSSIEDSNRLIHNLRGLVRSMEGVRLIQLDNALFARVQTGRIDRHYALPLRICAFVRSLHMPTEESGDVALASLLKDEILFSSLFEEFVRNFYRYEIGNQYSVGGEVLRWPDENENKFLPVMKTDISIVGKQHPFPRLVIDTKYYQEALASSQYGNATFRSGHLYQMYAYLRTQEERGEAFREAQGMLLYPTVDYQLDEQFNIQGHNMRLSTIDLTDEWEQIETRLLSLVQTDEE